jgi:pantothenate kinase
MEYRSKDAEYMRLLKKAILKGMAGEMPDHKQRIWEYIRKQVTMDDLVAYTIAETNQLVTFPTDNFNGKIMVLFPRAPTLNELEMLNKMILASRIPKEEFYITWIRKVDADDSTMIDLMYTIFDSEMKIIAPELILTFGYTLQANPHQITQWKGIPIMRTYDMNDILNHLDHADIESQKRALWDDVVQLIKLYKSN